MARDERHSLFTTGNSSEGRTERFVMRGKRFFITYPHCTMNKDVAVRILVERFGSNIREMVVAEEQHADESKHLHVLIHFKRDIKLTIPGAKLDDYVGHIEKVKCPVKAREYVMKEGVYTVYPKNTTSQKPKATTEELLHGDVNDLVENEKISVFSVERILKARRALEMNRPPEKEKPFVMWFFGETGYGKTYDAVNVAVSNGDTYWISNGTLQWFDGYHGQTVAILDEVRGNSCDWSFFLRLLDRYQLLVPVKGGFVNWTPKKIIITSSGRPEDVFVNHGTGMVWDSIQQLLRRIDEVWEYYAENEKRCIMEHGQATVPMEMEAPTVDLEEEPARTEFFYVAPPPPGPNDVPHLDPELEPMESFIPRSNDLPETQPLD